MTGLDATFIDGQSRIVEEWKTLLSFKSVSTAPEHNQDCLDCAAWLRDHIAQIGFDVELLETGSKPVVYAERRGAPGAPTVLFYGHYDVQPVDPIDAWTSPPFAPEIRDGCMYARGAQDNKGQHFYVLKINRTKADLTKQSAVHRIGHVDAGFPCCGMESRIQDCAAGLVTVADGVNN